jgi:hypothetical protein
MTIINAKTMTGNPAPNQFGELITMLIALAGRTDNKCDTLAKSSSNQFKMIKLLNEVCAELQASVVELNHRISELESK